ncbi:response regulator [Phormidesmis priestleyi]
MEGTKRVLIVDDEDDIRDVVQVSLEEFAGWLTITATSGLEGLQIAQTQALDAILMDISMPDMDGFQMYEQLQAEPTTQNIPLIVLTAKVLPNDRKRFAQLKIAGVITKPFDPMTIWRQVAEILGWAV